MLKALSQKLKTVPTYIYSNIVYPKILNSKYRTILNITKKLKNSQAGKRCFILATGPSINDLDLSQLRNEQTFVVNDFIRQPKFNDLAPSYYVMADTGFFDSTSEADFFGRNLKNKSDRLSGDTKIFLNIVGKDLIKKRNLFNRQQVYYLSIYGIISSNFDFNIDIDQTIPMTKNVVLTSLMVATYLGFKEIYLLGCEHSFLAKPIRQGSLNEIEHFYGVNYENDDVTDAAAIKEQGLYRSMVVTYEAEIGHVKQLFQNYRLFYQKIKKDKPEIKIYNATPNSFLDVFPFINFENITFKNK